MHQFTGFDNKGFDYANHATELAFFKLISCILTGMTLLDLNPGTHTFDTQTPSSKRRLLYQLS